MEHPVLAVYEALISRQVQFLLIGGQACIFYGASEFTRDSDFCVLCDDGNIAHLRGALESLEAENTFFPSLELQYLARGHACHFICRAKRASGFRVDVMSKLRGCPDYRSMWSEREMHRIGALEIPVIGVKHLVAAKKTQRDKDWPMVRRLVEEHYRRRGNETGWAEWWLRESRTPALLVELTARFPETAASLVAQRPLLSRAIQMNTDEIEEALLQEELAERRADRAYWEPLRKELEQMRHARR